MPKCNLILPTMIELVVDGNNIRSMGAGTAAGCLSAVLIGLEW
jgi:hypothetical protein